MMMTAERLAALSAVQAGTVTAKHLNVTGSPLVFEPRSSQVALGFLLKAQLIETHSATGHNRQRHVTIDVTERGKRVLSEIPA